MELGQKIRKTGKTCGFMGDLVITDTVIRSDLMITTRNIIEL